MQQEDDDKIRRDKILWVVRALAYISFIAVMLSVVSMITGYSKIRDDVYGEIKKTIEVAREKAEAMQEIEGPEPEDYYHESSSDE